jgi:ethanolamine ammonia-lyase small subunit
VPNLLGVAPLIKTDRPPLSAAIVRPLAAKNYNVMNTQTHEGKLFQFIDNIGETLTGNVHILLTEEKNSLGDKKYRVYHSAGYCFDLSREVIYNDDGTSYFEYEFNSDWPEFASLNAISALNLLKEQKF